MDTAINWARLGRAFDIFVASGYAPINVPWFVPKDVQLITCPYPENIMEVGHHGALIGSAEQAFIHMTLNGEIAKGRYVALTPCFRDEPEDATHSKTFMKIELYATGLDLHAEMNRMIADAMAVMIELGGVVPDKIQTREGWDLDINGVETGSYGVRAARNISWAYGTGLAEPRFSYAIGL